MKFVIVSCLPFCFYSCLFFKEPNKEGILPQGTYIVSSNNGFHNGVNCEDMINGGQTYWMPYDLDTLVLSSNNHVRWVSNKYFEYETYTLVWNFTSSNPKSDNFHCEGEGIWEQDGGTISGRIEATCPWVSIQTYEVVNFYDFTLGPSPYKIKMVDSTSYKMHWVDCDIPGAGIIYLNKIF